MTNFFEVSICRFKRRPTIGCSALWRLCSSLEQGFAFWGPHPTAVLGAVGLLQCAPWAEMDAWEPCQSFCRIRGGWWGTVRVAGGVFPQGTSEGDIYLWIPPMQGLAFSFAASETWSVSLGPTTVTLLTCTPIYWFVMAETLVAWLVRRGRAFLVRPHMDFGFYSEWGGKPLDNFKHRLPLSDLFFIVINWALNLRMDSRGQG